MMPESGRTVFTHSAARRGLDFPLLGDLQPVIDLDAEVSVGAFELGVSKQQLNGEFQSATSGSVEPDRQSRTDLLGRRS